MGAARYESRADFRVDGERRFASLDGGRQWRPCSYCMRSRSLGSPEGGHLALEAELHALEAEHPARLWLIYCPGSNLGLPVARAARGHSAPVRHERIRSAVHVAGWIGEDATRVPCDAAAMAPSTFRPSMIEEIAKHRGLRFYQELSRSGECHSMS